MAGPLQEREQDEEEEGEELNCDSHSEVSLFVEGALIEDVCIQSVTELLENAFVQ